MKKEVYYKTPKRAIDRFVGKKGTKTRFPPKNDEIYKKILEKLRKELW